MGAAQHMNVLNTASLNPLKWSSFDCVNLQHSGWLPALGRIGIALVLVLRSTWKQGLEGLWMALWFLLLSAYLLHAVWLLTEEVGKWAHRARLPHSSCYHVRYWACMDQWPTAGSFQCSEDRLKHLMGNRKQMKVTMVRANVWIRFPRENKETSPK
jgi:hypothetical protein